jgi:periplasmic protein TonB
MFENYVGAKQAKRPRWVVLLIAVSVAVHAVAAGALIVRSFWLIEKLTPPEPHPTLSLGPPPPPPPPKGTSRPDSLKEKVKRQKVTDTVQPQDKPEEIAQEELATSEEQEDLGVEGGVEGGVVGGVVGGVLGGVPGGVLGGTGAPPPPPPPEKPKIVPQNVLKEYRISGDYQITAPDTVKTLMVKQGQTKLIGTVKMCLSQGGSVESLRMVKSTGYDEYDQKILRSMRQWKYRPFQVNGRPTPVCTSVTFIYNQS